MTDERRIKPRIEALRAARVVFDGHATTVRVLDISETGALLSRVPGATVGALCVLQIPGYGSAAATIIRTSVGKTAVAFPADAILREQYGDPSSLFRNISAPGSDQG